MGIVTKIKESLHKDQSKEVTTTAIPISTTEHGNHLIENEKITSIESVETPRTSMDNHHQHLRKVRSPVVKNKEASSSNVDQSTTTVVQNPAIVKEKHLSDEVTEVTPVVERHITQPEIHQTVKPLHEKETIATTEAIVNPTITKTSGEEHQIRPDADGLAHLTSQLAISTGTHEREVAPTTKREIILEPIVNEVIHHEHVEQIQPIITKDVYHQHIKHVVQPITEHVVSPAIVHDVKVLSSTPVPASIRRHSPQKLTGNLVAIDVIEPKSKLML